MFGCVFSWYRLMYIGFNTILLKWKFPKLGIPPNHPFLFDVYGFSIVNHPAIAGIPMTQEPLHMLLKYRQSTIFDAAISTKRTRTRDLLQGLRSGVEVRQNDDADGRRRHHDELWLMFQAAVGWWWYTDLVGGLVAIFYFPHILGIIIPIDFHIFQRGWNHQRVGDYNNHYQSLYTGADQNLWARGILPSTNQRVWTLVICQYVWFHPVWPWKMWIEPYLMTYK